MFRRIRRLFVWDWKIVPPDSTRYFQYSNEVTIRGDASRWPTGWFRWFTPFWLIWRTILVVFNWRKRQVLIWEGNSLAYLAVLDAFGNELVLERLIRPWQVFALLKGREDSTVCMVEARFRSDPDHREIVHGLKDLGAIEDSALPDDVLRI